MLTNVLSGNDKEAAQWARSGNFSQQPFSLVKDAFWETYLETGEYEISAEAARRQIRLLGWHKVQLTLVTHYADPSFNRLSQLIPCETCIDGSLGGYLFEYR